MNKDLNLLRTFRALWEEKNVSRAAKKVGLSQPAMSNALARLRDDFKDELFVRAPRGVVPTPLAEDIQSQVQAVLEAIEGLYVGGEEFDPATSHRTVVIATTDYFEQILLADFFEVMAKQAPNMKLVSKPLDWVLPKEDMQQGKCDLAIAGFFKDLPEGYYQQRLLEDHFKCVVRKNHPDVGKSIGLKNYLKLKHLLISPSGELRGLVDKKLAQKNLSRNVVGGIFNFMSPGPVVQKTDCILTAPGRLCHQFEKLYGLKVLDCPVDMPSIKVVQVWHARVHKDPAIQWIRKVIQDLSSSS